MQAELDDSGEGEPVNSHNPADIIKLARSLADKVAGLVERHRRQGEVNEKFVQGDQWSASDMRHGTRRHQGDAWFDNEGVPRIWVNLLRNLESTWSALLVKDRPNAKAVAANDDPLATYRSDLTNQIIDYFIHELDTADKVHKACSYACQHGTAGLKVLFVPGNNPGTGEVTLEPVTVFDFLIDPCSDYHNAKWVIFTSHIDEEEAEALYEAAGIKKNPKSEKWKNSAGETMEGVPQQELWLKPNRDYPKGLFACIVGDQVVEQMDYPYVFSRDGDGDDEALLPIVLMKVRDVRGSPYGATSLTDCIPLQRSYNETVSRLVKLMRNTSATHLIVPHELKKHFNPEQDSVLWFNQSVAASAGDIRYTEPPTINPVLFDLRDFFAKAMSQVIGINDVTSGNKTGSISGRAIENIVELDSQKNADATKSLEVMILDMWRLILDLVRRYYTVPRKVKMLHRPVADVLLFNSSDIQGVDVRLEPGSEIDRLSSVREQSQAERIKNGLAPASSLGQAQNAPGYGMSREAAEKLVQEFLAGGNVDINPGDFQLEVVAGVIEEHRAAALQQGRGQDYASLTSLLQQVKQLAQQAAQQAPPQQEGAETNEPQGQPAQPAQPTA